MTDGEDLGRAFEFIARGDMSGMRTAPSRYGTAVFNETLPRRYDCNYVVVDSVAAGIGAQDLIDDLATVDRPMLLVRDGASAERLVQDFEKRGWEVNRGVVMALREVTPKSPDLGLVREVDESTLRPARRARYATESWATDEVVAQLLDAKLFVAARLDVHFLAVFDGEEVVSYGEVYLDDDTAQIEDIATLEAHRGKGLASAIVMYAVNLARAKGCRLVFLVADDEDWPKEWYRTLGFADLGRYLKFIRPSAAPG